MCERKHLVGHVETIGLAGWTNTTRRKQNIDAATRTQVKNGFSGPELRQRGWIPTAQRGVESGRRHASLFQVIVEITCDGIAFAAATARGAATCDELGRFRVFVSDRFFDFHRRLNTSVLSLRLPASPVSGASGPDPASFAEL